MLLSACSTARYTCALVSAQALLDANDGLVLNDSQDAQREAKAEGGVLHASSQAELFVCAAFWRVPARRWKQSGQALLS